MVVSKIAVIGAGSVGSTIAYALMLKDVASEVLLVDVSEDVVRGQILDLGDAGLVSSTKVRAGTNQEASQADIIIITAGAKQRKGESRTELIERNYRILNTIIGQMQPIRQDAILLIVANPVDVLTAIAQKLSGLPRKQVIGAGTFLDSSRLRVMLANILDVSASAVHAYVLGEHGDTQFVAWNAASVAGKPLLSFPQIQQLDREKVEKTIASKAMEIIHLKGATYYGIGACAADLCESIILDKREVRPLSVYVERLDAVLSMPAKFGWEGIMEVYDVPLTEDEEKKLKASADAMREIVDKYHSNE
ncbi:hypothetical protein DFQ28_007246 [Apophysomyces sp. BC1034]|nr:hypothetical protein DFQ30_006342 [Apophysomyces sp. BC1015]KAG0182284.1 hypothetical protein DFQ29_005015 [Apophysomyces sp. BC1021]KAG0192903.1 hypothetical protein DFQ28_007246 [Apophysomyces sp. BC1034]